MSNTNYNERTSFAINLLCELKNIYVELEKYSADIETCSNSFYEKLFSERKADIAPDIEQYKNNMEKIKQLNNEVTSLINAWYDFTKDSNQIKKLIYPLYFYFKKRSLDKGVKNINTMIQNLTIENRFIKEKITVWEHELEIKAIQLIKEDKDYHHYENLLKKKDLILKELQYLLPSIPGICPLELESNSLDLLIEKLSKIPAA
ncbi:MAG: hypothetical protein N2645_10140 [Clostridia bacterium]|nr:hypothetical protein [Clostridia bacterium]